MVGGLLDHEEASRSHRRLSLHPLKGDIRRPEPNRSRHPPARMGELSHPTVSQSRSRRVAVNLPGPYPLIIPNPGIVFTEMSLVLSVVGFILVLRRHGLIATHGSLQPWPSLPACLRPGHRLTLGGIKSRPPCSQDHPQVRRFTSGPGDRASWPDAVVGLLMAKRNGTFQEG